MVEILVQKSAEFKIDLNVKDFNGKTAFHYACENGWSEITKLIIDKKRGVEVELHLILKKRTNCRQMLLSLL